MELPKGNVRLKIAESVIGQANTGMNFDKIVITPSDIPCTLDDVFKKYEGISVDGEIPTWIEAEEAFSHPAKIVVETCSDEKGYLFNGTNWVNIGSFTSFGKFDQISGAEIIYDLTVEKAGTYAFGLLMANSKSGKSDQTDALKVYISTDDCQTWTETFTMDAKNTRTAVDGGSPLLYHNLYYNAYDFDNNGLSYQMYLPKGNIQIKIQENATNENNAALCFDKFIITPATYLYTPDEILRHYNAHEINAETPTWLEAEDCFDRSEYVKDGVDRVPESADFWFRNNDEWTLMPSQTALTHAQWVKNYFITYDLWIEETGEKELSFPPLGHAWTEADCTAPKTCERCFATDGKTLPHEYDNNCDAYCNVCNESRKVEHTPNEDDGDCTTEITCSECKTTLTPAKASHVANADDGNCTTAVTCKECNSTITEAMSHDFTGEWVNDDEGHYHICQNDGCNVTDEKQEHTPGAPATFTTPESCTECGFVITPTLEHSHTYDILKHNATSHWYECSCGEAEETLSHIPEEDDKNCETSTNCSVCGEVMTPSADHIPSDDDGDCTTPIRCSICETITTAANTKHIPSEDDNDCTTPICCTVCGTVTSDGESDHKYDDGHDSTCNNENCTKTRSTQVDHYDNNGDQICDVDGCDATVHDVDLPLDKN